MGETSADIWSGSSGSFLTQKFDALVLAPARGLLLAMEPQTYRRVAVLELADRIARSSHLRAGLIISHIHCHLKNSSVRRTFREIRVWPVTRRGLIVSS